MGYEIDYFLELPSNKKAFIMGSIIKHLEDKKKESDKIGRAAKSKSRK